MYLVPHCLQHRSDIAAGVQEPRQTVSTWKTLLRLLFQADSFPSEDLVHKEHVRTLVLSPVLHVGWGLDCCRCFLYGQIRRGEKKCMKAFSQVT